MSALLQINDKARNTIGWIVRLLILGGCVWFISRSVEEKWTFDLRFSADQWQVIVLVFLLAFVNWGLEVWRWKFSLDKIEKTGWREASRQVFGGLALNWIVPFTGGDLLARLTRNKDRKQVGMLIYHNRAVMLMLTIIFGMFGVYRYSAELFASNVWFVCLFLAGIFLIGYLGRKFILGVEKVGGQWLIWLSMISILRYVVFVVQFVLLIWVFNQDLKLVLIFAGVGWIFLFRSVIPSLFGNLGVREASALVFFEGYISEPSLILIPSLLIWMINTVLPSILGLYYLTRFPIKIAQ